MFLDRTLMKTPFIGDVIALLPVQSIPLKFTKQGDQGVFLIFVNSGIQGILPDKHKFKVLLQGDEIPPVASWFGEVKDGKYKQVFKI